MMVVEETELDEQVAVSQENEANAEEEVETEAYIEEEIESTEDHENRFYLVKEDITDQSLTCYDRQTILTVSAPCSAAVYKEDGLMSYMDVLLLLKSIDPLDDRLTRVPPQRPIVAGQVYVYALSPGQSAYDWRFDGFQWANLRANTFPKKNSEPILTRHEFRLLDNGTKVDFYRHEYHEPGHSFKNPINIAHWKYPYIVIHYFGNYPVNEAQLAPHAGRRNGGGPIIRTPKKSKHKELLLPLNNPMAQAISSAVASLGGGDVENVEILEDETRKRLTVKMEPETEVPTKLQRQNPVHYYGAVVESDGHKIIDLSQLALLTANGIEVTGPNLKRRHPNSNSKRPRAIQHAPVVVDKDDMYGCYVFHETFGSQPVVRLLDFTAGATIIIAEDHLVSHINTLTSTDFPDGRLAFTYQPTAKLYRFLVTTLFVKHPIFESQPYIPIAVLLHRGHSAETHGRFFATMKDLIPVLNSADIDLIVCDEAGVTKAVENELAEIPTVHVSDISSPRISSSKLDYLLVSVAKSLTFDHTKMIHLVYFLQCHFYNEIVRSIVGVGTGDLQVHSKFDASNMSAPSLGERLLPESSSGAIQMLEDALTPSEVITMLSRNPPQVLGSGSDYEGCTQNELQLFEGLAHFFIAKDRIEWVKGRGIFSVKGLGGKEYHVKLSGRTCTCYRAKACEHVLAVLIATGLLTRQQ